MKPSDMEVTIHAEILGMEKLETLITRLERLKSESPSLAFNADAFAIAMAPLALHAASSPQTITRRALFSLFRFGR